MSIEVLEQAIEEAQSHLDGREAKRLIAWAVVTLLTFLLPVFMLFQFASEDSIFVTNYAPVVLVWLMVSMGISNVIATALIAPRTVELRLALATATSTLSLLKERKQDRGHAD